MAIPLGALACAAPDVSAASPASVQRGLLLTKLECARCHAVEGTAASPLPEAPPFPALLQTYPGQALEELLSEVLLRNHPPMPAFAASTQARDDLLDYLRSVQRRSPAAQTDRRRWPGRRD